MSFLIRLPWRGIVAIAVTTTVLWLAYDLSITGNQFARRAFLWPIEAALRWLR